MNALVQQALALPEPPPYPDARPRCRGECACTPRPCVHIGCRHHIAIDRVNSDGEIQWAQVVRHFAALLGVQLDDECPDLLPVLRAMPETCSLDVADEGEATDRAIGEVLGVSKQRIDQIEKRGRLRIRNSPRARVLLPLLAMANEKQAGQHECAVRQLPLARSPQGEQTAIVHFQAPRPGSWRHRQA